MEWLTQIDSQIVDVMNEYHGYRELREGEYHTNPLNEVNGDEVPTKHAGEDIFIVVTDTILDLVQAVEDKVKTKEEDAMDID